MSKLAKEIEDKRALKLIRSYLNAEVMIEGLFVVPQPKVCLKEVYAKKVIMNLMIYRIRYPYPGGALSRERKVFAVQGRPLWEKAS